MYIYMCAWTCMCVFMYVYMYAWICIIHMGPHSGKYHSYARLCTTMMISNAHLHARTTISNAHLHARTTISNAHLHARRTISNAHTHKILCSCMHVRTKLVLNRRTNSERTCSLSIIILSETLPCARAQVAPDSLYKNKKTQNNYS